MYLIVSDKIEKYFPNAWYILFAVMISAGVFFLISGGIYFSIMNKDVVIESANFEIIATGVNILITLGIGSFSLAFAFLSVGIAKESDRRIFHSSFIEIFHKFEDTRIQLVQHPEKLGIEGTIWKCWTYVDWADELKGWTNKKYQNKLAWQFIILYEGSRINWNDSIVKKSDVKNMIKMYDSLSKFNINNKNRDKLEQINNDLQKILKEK